MNYRNRHLEGKINRLRSLFPALLVVGARQVGKSTLLSHLLGSGIPQVVFDPVLDVGDARRDPEFFLAQHPPPLLLDEIQYAPELLPAIKRRIDQDGRAGQYFLTGSQNPALLRSVAESLAGRAVVIELRTMSLVERCGLAEGSENPWIEDLFAAQPAERLRARSRLPERAEQRTLFARLWRGGQPQALDLPDDVLPDLFASYLRTYIERDVRLLAAVEDQQLFGRFLGLCAALTAQEVNHSHLGREVGVSPNTAHRWLAALRASFQWVEVPPYHGSAVKRVSRRPKGYLADTGLAAHLQRISTPQALAGHPSLGALFETHVVLEVARETAVVGTPPLLHHWRSHGGAEVDLVLERDGTFVPVEIRAATRITEGDARGIRAFRASHPRLRHGPGAIVAAVDAVRELRDGILVVPYDLK